MPGSDGVPRSDSTRYQARHPPGGRAARDGPVHDPRGGVADGVVVADEDGDVLALARGELAGAVDGVDEDGDGAVGLRVDAGGELADAGEGGLDDGVELLGDHQVVDGVGLGDDVDLGLVLLADDLGELAAGEEVLDEHVLDDACRTGVGTAC